MPQQLPIQHQLGQPDTQYNNNVDYGEQKLNIEEPMLPVDGYTSQPLNAQVVSGALTWNYIRQINLLRHEEARLRDQIFQMSRHYQWLENNFVHHNNMLHQQVQSLQRENEALWNLYEEAITITAKDAKEKRGTADSIASRYNSLLPFNAATDQAQQEKKKQPDRFDLICVRQQFDSLDPSKSCPATETSNPELEPGDALAALKKRYAEETKERVRAFDNVHRALCAALDRVEALTPPDSEVANARPGQLYILPTRFLESINWADKEYVDIRRKRRRGGEDAGLIRIRKGVEKLRKDLDLEKRRRHEAEAMLGPDGKRCPKCHPVILNIDDED